MNMKKTYIKPGMQVVELRQRHQLLVGSANMDAKTGRFSITNADEGEEGDYGW